jgi:phage baseplate assembly protein W
MTEEEIIYLVPYQTDNKKRDIIIFGDIDLSLTPHPLTKDLITKTNAEAIKRSLRHIFMWRKWDNPFNPESHNHLMDLLFELNTIFTQAAIRTRSEWLIRQYEPRVTVKRLDVIPRDDEAGYNISIYYVINDIRLEDNLNLYLQRVR